jgi:hypothetical protein
MKADRHPFHARRVFLGEMLRGLELLEADLEASSRNIEYLYVVDFAALYAYAYSEIHDDFSVALPDEPRERLVARRVIALKLIFEQDRRELVLIPPYAAELRNHVRAESIRVSLADLDTRSMYRAKLQALISHSAEFVEFLRSARSDASVANEVRQKALEVGKRFFPELYAVLAGQTRAGLKALHALFERGALVDSEHAIPEMVGFDYGSARASIDGWYRPLSKRRGALRAFQTFIDALACGYVQRANEILNASGKVVVFVAPSGVVRDVLRHHNLVSIATGTPVECVRDLDYFLLEFSHRRDLNAVRESVRSIKSLLATLDAADSPDVALRVDQLSIGQDTSEKWREAENYLLMGGTHLLEDLIATIPAAAPDEVFLSLLQELYKAARDSPAEMEREGLELISTLKADIFELYKWIPPPRAVASFLPLDIDQIAKGARIRFPGFVDDAPVVLRIVEPAVVSFAKRLKAVADHVSRDALLEMRAVVLASAAQAEAGPEEHLLAAYMLALEGKPDPALREIDRGMLAAGDAGHAELYYLAGMIRRRLFEPARAIEMLEKALAIRPTDERFLLEVAKAYWLTAYSKRLIDRPGATDWLRRARDAVERAAGHGQSNEDATFDAQLNNVRAFVSCEIALSESSSWRTDLEVAFASIAELELLIPEREWIGRFFDTRAWVAYTRASLDASIAPADRRVLLLRALADVQRALELETTVDSRKHLLQEHRACIELELSQSM